MSVKQSDSLTVLCDPRVSTWRVKLLLELQAVLFVATRSGCWCLTWTLMHQLPVEAIAASGFGELSVPPSWQQHVLL